jgi:hypothetical protein
MPRLSPGEAMPDVPETAETNWWRFRHYHPRSAQDAHVCYTSGYQHGYRDALHDMAVFASLQRDVQRLAELLEAQRVERLAVEMVEDERV